MVDSVKNYGIAGVAANIELGKAGKKIVGSSGKVSLQHANASVSPAEVANGTSASHAVTKAQLDVIEDPKVQFLKSTVNYNSGNVTIGTTNSNTIIHSVSITKGTNWTDANDTTNITVGDDSDVDRLFATFDPDAQTVDQTNYTYTSATTLKAYVTQGGASAGTATVVVFYSGVITT